MPGDTGFFGKKSEKNAYYSFPFKRKAVRLNMGGKGDCGFRSVAASMVDNILEKPSANEILARKLLHHYAHYFPNDYANHFPGSTHSLSPLRRLNILIDTPAKRSDFILKMSYVLRQIAVDEIVAKPQEYRGAFVDKHEGTDPQKMRQAATWIDESAIAALANALSLPIVVKVVNASHEIPLRLNYEIQKKEVSGSPISLQLESGHYVALVKNPEQFDLVAQKVQASNPVQSSIELQADPNLDKILAQIDAYDSAVLKEYEQTLKRLEMMFKNGEITQDDLKDIYIEGTKHSDYLQGRSKYAGLGIEHGNQLFIQALQSRHASKTLGSGMQAHEISQKSEAVDWLSKELIQAIARGVSIGHLSHAVYENIERPSHFHPI